MNLLNYGDIFGILSCVIILLGGVLQFFLYRDDKIEGHTKKEVSHVQWNNRLKKGLEKSRKQFSVNIRNLFSSEGLKGENLESVEELLYGADIGTKLVAEIIDILDKKISQGNLKYEDFKNFLYDFLRLKMEETQKSLDADFFNFNNKSFEVKGPKVIMVVGVNGAGKTTTIGKLATKIADQGGKVVIGACDTFRAAAVDQLEVWSKRAKAQIVVGKEGANPSGVGYEALKRAIEQKADYCILDTAGRIHTKEHLMDELVKSRDVLRKLDLSSPHQTLLVIDAISGQNSLRQAEEFHKRLLLTGLIFTKCDGSSKGGAALTIVDALKIPVAYIGVGEGVDDLNRFDLEDYLKALLDISR